MHLSIIFLFIYIFFSCFTMAFWFILLFFFSCKYNLFIYLFMFFFLFHNIRLIDVIAIHKSTNKFEYVCQHFRTYNYATAVIVSLSYRGRDTLIANQYICSSLWSLIHQHCWSISVDINYPMCNILSLNFIFPPYDIYTHNCTLLPVYCFNLWL